MIAEDDISPIVKSKVEPMTDTEEKEKALTEMFGDEENINTKKKENTPMFPDVCEKCLYRNYKHTDFPCSSCSIIYNGKNPYFTSIKDHIKVEEFGCVDCKCLVICEFMDMPKCSIENRLISYMSKCPNKE